ncbi:MAG: hypothetical protein ACW96X_12895 [Promethearchaeota archaeon]
MSSGEGELDTRLVRLVVGVIGFIMFLGGIMVLFLMWSIPFRLPLGLTLIVVGFLFLMVGTKAKVCYCLQGC